MSEMSCYGSSAIDASEEILQGFPALHLVEDVEPSSIPVSFNPVESALKTEEAPSRIGSVAGLLCRKVPVVDADIVRADRIVPPTTTLDAVEVNHLLDKRNRSTPDLRVASLLDYAWDHPAIQERAVPSELLSFVIELMGTGSDGRPRPSQWYIDNLRAIDTITRGHNLRPGRDGKRYEYYYTIEDIEEDTEPYNTTSFIRNTLTIKSITWHDPEGKKVELSARILIHKAMLAMLAATEQ